ncbi:MAG: MBL fold metallo-hydrolase [Gammaproteobacteria bacterium]
MDRSRNPRQAFASLVLACALVWLGPVAAQVERLAEGTYLYRSGAQRSLFLVGDEGVIVTDPVNADAAVAYRAAIAELTDAPVRYVVYSHYHWDRVSGGRIFRDEGATFVAQARCARRFADNPNPAVVAPDITFDDSYRVSVGNRSLELFYFGPSHGDCLTVFLARPANLLQVVDLVNPPRAAFPADPNVPYIRPHNLRQFFSAVERLIGDEGIVQIVASAAPGPIRAPASIVGEQARFWHEVYTAVDHAIEQGNVGIDSFVRMKTVDLSRFENFAGYSESGLRFVMRRISGWHDMGR